MGFGTSRGFPKRRQLCAMSIKVQAKVGVNVTLVQPAPTVSGTVS